MRYCKDEGLEVFRCKHNISRDEADLTEYNRGKNETPQMLPEKGATNITERAFDFETGIDQENEAVVAEQRDTQQDQVTKQHAPVKESFWEKEDTCSNKRLEEKESCAKAGCIGMSSPFLVLAASLARRAWSEERTILHWLSIASPVVCILIESVRGEIFVWLQNYIIFFQLFAGEVAVHSQKFKKVIC